MIKRLLDKYKVGDSIVFYRYSGISKGYCLKTGTIIARFYCFSLPTEYMVKQDDGVLIKIMRETIIRKLDK